MGELKSAWEIAQGKADKLGKLSAEELQQQREEKCRQIGQTIAQRYLDNVESLNLGIELDGHPEEERGLIKRAVASCLIQVLNLSTGWGTRGGPGAAVETYRSGGGCARREKIVEGIASREAISGGNSARVWPVFHEYEGATRGARHEIERKGKEILHRLRISGTAVADINVEAMPQWQQTWHRLRKPFEPRLDTLKQELINSI